MDCISCFYCCWDKYLTRINFNEQRVNFGSQFRRIPHCSDIAALIPQSQTVTVSGNCSYYNPIRNQRETNADAPLTRSSVFSPGPQPVEWGHSHSGWLFLQLRSPRHTLIDAQGCASIVLYRISLN